MVWGGNGCINKEIESCSIVSNNTVKVWIMELDNFLPFKELFCSFLAEDEKEKYRSFKNKLIKTLYVLRKGMTRKVISDFLNLPPEGLQILYDNKNKPYILGEKVNYNISHSSNYFMIGISRGRKIGVDIQKINEQKKELSISIFSKQELEKYNSYDHFGKREFFWKTWVLKEAITKATGDGMTTNFCDIDTCILEATNENIVELQYSKDVYLNVKVSVNKLNDFAYSYCLLKEN